MLFTRRNIKAGFAGAEMAHGIGASEVTNPSARTDPKPPIAGMPTIGVVEAMATADRAEGLDQPAPAPHAAGCAPNLDGVPVLSGTRSSAG